MHIEAIKNQNYEILKGFTDEAVFAGEPLFLIELCQILCSRGEMYQEETAGRFRFLSCRRCLPADFPIVCSQNRSVYFAELFFIEICQQISSDFSVEGTRNLVYCFYIFRLLVRIKARGKECLEFLQIKGGTVIRTGAAV